VFSNRRGRYGLCIFILCLLVIGAFSLAIGQEKPDAVTAKSDRIVTIPKDDTQFKVKVGEFVRVSGSGPSGVVEISAKSEGPIKLTASSVIRTVAHGHPLIGEFIKEFDFKADQKGQAKIVILIENNIQKSSEKKEFNIDVE
ncbi:MAG: hypothetical protein ABSE63_01830, partial [Thermoguttaceae bacterium]